MSLRALEVWGYSVINCVCVCVCERECVCRGSRTRIFVQYVYIQYMCVYKELHVLLKYYIQSVSGV